MIPHLRGMLMLTVLFFSFWVGAKERYVLLISIDGYRYNYTDQYNPPALSVFKKSSLAARALLPVFPTKTFPNHISISTGLHPSQHGIVDNYFYSPKRDKIYTLKDTEAVTDAAWYSGRPLWMDLQEKNIMSAVYYWPGSEAPGMTPSVFKKYDESVPDSSRAQQIIDWLQGPVEKRPHFMALYFSTLDTAGHRFGPQSSELKEALLHLDEIIGKLLEDLEKIKLPINIIILSDHGMTEIDSQKRIYVDELVNLSAYLQNRRITGPGSMIMIYEPDPQKALKLKNELQAKAKFFKVYLKKELPPELHFSDNERIGDVVILADCGASLQVHMVPAKNQGDHGYAVKGCPDMKSIFYARGPDISPGEIGEFSNLQIKPFILSLLGIPVKNLDGRLKKHLIK
jgi:predicted AlkP superfamily pyrophosphatase or phosphodiesterase